MRNLLLTVILLLNGCNLVAQENIIIQYQTELGEIIKVYDGGYYDVEGKPLFYSLKIKDEGFLGQNNHVVIVDLYRLMTKKGSSPDQVNPHYFKTIILTNGNRNDGDLLFEDGIPIDDLMYMNKSRFYYTTGFIIDLCIVSKNKLLSINTTKDCIKSKSVRILYRN